MPKGGYREGAGRKKGVTNLLTSELRDYINAPRLIKLLQDIAEGRIEGSSISERKDAAIALLKKVLPDMSHNKAEIEGVTFEPVTIMLDRDEPDGPKY